MSEEAESINNSNHQNTTTNPFLENDELSDVQLNTNGNFVGRDTTISSVRKVSVVVGGNLNGNLIIYPNTDIGVLGAEIRQIKSRIARLLPTDNALFVLTILRSQEPMTAEQFGFNTFLKDKKIIKDEIPLSIGAKTVADQTFRTALDILLTAIPGASFAQAFRSQFLKTKNDTGNSNSNLFNEFDWEKYNQNLNEIEIQLHPELEQVKKDAFWKEIKQIHDRVNIRISQLNTGFKGTIYTAIASKKIIESKVSQIGHGELKDEAIAYCETAIMLANKLNPEELTVPSFDVLSDQAQVAISIMTEIEKRRIMVDNLLKEEHKRQWQTSLVVIGYIITLIIIGVICLLWFGPQQLEVLGNKPLKDTKLALFGVPWAVVVWSAIGSSAALLRRFNTNPTHKFTDALKWVVTRPVQGVVMASAVYLLLLSGLFNINIGTGSTTTTSTNSAFSDYVLLLISFLVGFYDFFAEGLFSTLPSFFQRNSPGQDGRRRDERGFSNIDTTIETVPTLPISKEESKLKSIK